MNKMRSFWKILLQKMAFGLLGGIITCLIISTIVYIFFTEYEDNHFSDVYEKIQGRVGDIIEEGPVSELRDKISFRMAVDAEVSNGINYIYMEDEKTGEIVASSDRRGFLVLRDKNTEEKTKVYRVDGKYIQPLNKYDNIDIRDRLYFWTDGTLTFTPLVKPEFYTIYVKSAYRGEDEAYPSNIEVMGSSDWLEEMSEERLIEAITLTPDNPEDYQYVEKSEDYTMLFVLVGNSFVPQIDSFAKKMLDEPFAENENSVVTSTYDGFFWPGRGAFYGKYRVVDSENKSYIVYYLGEFYFKDLALYVITVNVLILLIFIIIAIVKAKRQYNRDKYKYSIIAYQNNLIDVMAHDLRTPIMAMSGYAENLKEEANAEKRDYYADAILKNADHMSQIISRNLELTKIDTEDIKKNYKKIELVGMLKDSLSGYKPIFEEKKITVNIDGSFEINGDETMMKTAIDNLGSNMVKYVNDGGSIDIAVKGKLLTISNTTDEVVNNPLKLWEPFVRGDESRSNQGGTGLGLAIAHGIFDKHKLKSKLTLSRGKFTIELKK